MDCSRDRAAAATYGRRSSGSSPSSARSSIDSCSRCSPSLSLRVVMSGAGTSSFIGDCLVPALSVRLQRRVEAIATTDLVSGPQLQLQSDVPTLLVSFARSGNSPESVAAVDFAERAVADVHHLIITCNAEGELAKRASGTA